jgi:hypothetical protein
MANRARSPFAAVIRPPPATTHPLVLAGRATSTSVEPELEPWAASPPYWAVMTCPARLNEVKNTAQLADGPLPDKVQGLPKNRPVPLLVKLTFPVGASLPLPAVSVTVALHTVAPPGANTTGEQLTVVDVGCWLTPVTSNPS